MAGDELAVITKAFDLAREMTERTRKLPRDLKFVLGDRMLATAYDVLDTLVEAKYARAKRQLLSAPICCWSACVSRCGSAWRKN
jgi:hypothetical protein